MSDIKDSLAKPTLIGWESFCTKHPKLALSVSVFVVLLLVASFVIAVLVGIKQLMTKDNQSLEEVTNGSVTIENPAINGINMTITNPEGNVEINTSTSTEYEDEN